MTVQRTPDLPVDSTIAALVSGYVMNAPLEENLAAVTAAAVPLVEGVDYAEVMVISEGRLRSVGLTALLITDLDDLQLDLRDGPCLQAAVEGAMIRCTSARGHEVARVRGRGARCRRAQRVVLSDPCTAPRIGRPEPPWPRPPHRRSRHRGDRCPTGHPGHRRADDAETQRQFGVALASRDLIGQAKGILMNHFKIDADRAFGMLRTLSQDGNTPLRTVAQDVIDTL